MSAATLSYSERELAKLNVNNYSSLIELFDETCAEHAHKPAFSCIGQVLTFADIEQKSRAFAAWLLTAGGLSKGDRIAVQLPNLNQYPIVAWGALRAGLTLVNTNPLYTEREQVHQFTDSGAKALVVLSDLLPMTEKVVPQTGIKTVIATHVFDLIEPQPRPESSLPNLISLPEVLAAGAQMELPKSAITMSDIAVLQYTGGTTGVAKGAVLSHGNLFAGSQQSASAIEVDEDSSESDIVISPMPLYHVYGFTVNVIGNFLAGGLSVLIPDPRDMDGLVNTMKQYRFTALAGVNTLLSGLMRHPDFDSIDFSAVKGTIAGGAALVKEIADEWQRRTNSQIFEGYGLSETSSALTCNSPENNQLGTVGKPLISMEVKVVDEDSNTLAVGAEGELLVRGPQVLQGYWQRPEATAEVLDADGWFRTGDVAIIQQDGFIRIVDRLKDMVLVSGFNVYPNEIEDVVYTHPDIIEAAVVGVPDPKTGEAVKLFVVSTNPDLTEAEVRSFCREHLTAYKVPKTVEFQVELPKSNVGKILRRELRD
jgi:long-chain acyl-CoA synthetase